MQDLRARAFAVELNEIVNPVGQMKELLHLSTEAWIVYFDGRPAVLWGVFTESLISDEAAIWTVTTNVVDQYPFMFLRASQEIVKYLLVNYSRLMGRVMADYDRSQKWLRWLGFEIGNTYMFEGLAVKNFEKRR